MGAETKQMPSCGLCRIELSNLGVRIEQEQLLQGVNLHVHCGELTMLIGPNGGGKTTLLRAVLGQLPYAGQISHVDAEGRPFASPRIGYVPQHLYYDRQMPLTVRDLLASAMDRRPVWTGVSKKARLKVQETLMLAQAEGLMNKRLGALSGGELQRVLLAMALSPTPDLLILDEPISGVDHNGQAQFLDTVNQLRQDKHMAILMVSHDWTLVSEYADQVILLNKTVLMAGNAQTVFDSGAFAEAFPHSHAGRSA